ncbi:hypothetical protein HPB49_005654 [Dermacentor silvarum]|uniref:Uncharacterized protein n=1 Tax=Dermacentor silvarum TaxID=543639 RepID=A0ACB8CQ48_DERSI|nr:hypothetical protein HPB49_005654 [Dermacentor silvarum]
MVSARPLKDVPLFGVDSRWSWITAFFCAWVLFLAMATPRMAGIFFYGIVETFGATREEASWPVSLPGTFTVLGGPIAGYVCQRFSCRAVLLFCSFVLFTAGTYIMITADLASDRGLHPSNAVYFLQALSAADIAFRSVVGIAIDSRTLSLESIMLLGYVVQGLACEWLVWANTSPQMAVASILVGATYGSRTCLQAPALAKDFGIDTLPVVFGGVLFCTGVSLLIRPLLIGYYRDNYGDYTGLLHMMAALNGVFMCIWTLMIISKRRAGTTASPETAHDTHLSQSSANENGSLV